MRSFFEPDEEDAFAAAQDLLVRRLTTWAQGRGCEVTPLVVEAASQYRHLETIDGRLTLWNPPHVREFLLDWLPRNVTLQPGDELPDAPGTLALLLRYFDECGLADPRGAAPEANERAIAEAAAEFPAAMADTTRWGVAKYWMTTAAQQGVDVRDIGALQRWVERAQRGEVPYDAELLEELVMRHHERGGTAAERAPTQLPVRLPAQAELRTAAENSLVVQRLRDLARWPGATGRPLTDTGRLRMADARQLVAELDTGDPVTQVRSATDLPVLELTYEWAKRARLVRTVKGRLHSVAKAAPLLEDPLALWERAFDTVFELAGPLCGPRGWRPESMFFLAYHEVLPDVLNSLYSLRDPMPWPQLRMSVHEAYRERFLLGDDDLRTTMAFELADADLRRVLDVLVDLGVITRSEGTAPDMYLDHDPVAAAAAGMPAELAERFEQVRVELTAGPVELIQLTDLGTHGVRKRLLAEGRDAPLIGELATAPAAGLLGVLSEHYDPESTRAEGEAWIAAHGGRAAAIPLLVEAVAVMPYRFRATGMLSTLAMILGEDDGTALLHELRAHPTLAPMALALLTHRDVLHPAECTPEEEQLVIAENMIHLVESIGPAETLEGLLRNAPKAARTAVEVALSSGHPDETGLAELRTLVADQLRTRAHPFRLRRNKQGRRKPEGRRR